MPLISSWVAFVLAAALPAGSQIKVRLTERDGGVVQTISLERYVAGVLAGESSVFRSDAAERAMAIAARTYAVRLRGRHASEGFDFCATTHCQRFEEMGITARMERAVSDTKGELLWFQGKPAFACYTRDCGGRSEEISAVWPEIDAPYLNVHSDPYCQRSSSAGWQWRGAAGAITEALHNSALRSPQSLERIDVAQRTKSGRAKVLDLQGGDGAMPIAAGSFRFSLGRSIGWNTVRSDLYEVHRAGGVFVFEGRGSGHGVGLCQIGADQMGVEGRSTAEILAFYYPGTAIGLNAKAIDWTRLSGENLTLLTTQPGQDREVLAKAEAWNRAIAAEMQTEPVRGIQIRIYPDVETFRNATAEPGWVAARTQANRIDLQPAAILRNKGVLESTLRHELLHALVEGLAKPGTPVWFREGLVEYLSHSQAFERTPASLPQNELLRQRSDPPMARRGYAQAVEEVRMLVKTYGKDRVLGWLRQGIPREVTNMAESHAETQSR